MILAIDTSGALSSVALVDRDRVVIERTHLDARRHAEVLAPMVAEVIADLAPGRVAAIACGVGPGPYTGLRVGIVTAIAMARAWQVPVHGICSLDAVAAAALASGAPAGADGLGVALDARRHEVYWARYSPAGDRLEGPRVSRAADLDPVVRSGWWTGSGAVLYRHEFADVPADLDPALMHPHASWVGRRTEQLLDRGAVQGARELSLDAHGTDSGATARAIAGATLLEPRPLYLRRPDAVPSSAGTPSGGLP